MSDLTTKALEAEESGNLEAAAKFYAFYSFRELVESNYRIGSQMRRGLTHMLESISADVRAGNYERAQTHLQLIEPLLKQLHETTDEESVQGLSSEWLGDAHLMVGNYEVATKYYGRALETFHELSLEDRLFWGAEPEFDSAYGAMKKFLADYDIQYSNEYTMEFEDRIRTKIKASKTELGGG